VRRLAAGGYCLRRGWSTQRLKVKTPLYGDVLAPYAPVVHIASLKAFRRRRVSRQRHLNRTGQDSHD
jgi:hypothetical protein